jgi:4-hydroxymandelate oxidase
MSGRPATLEEFEKAARLTMAEMVYEYVASGAGDELTIRANRDAYDRIGLLPDLPADVSQLRTDITLFGEVHPAPLLLAPTAYHRMIHPEGELETIRGANLCDCTMVASSFATVAFDEVQALAKRRQWFQLYVHPDRGLTKAMVQQVQDEGCGAICLTIDLTVNPTRDREVRAGFELTQGMTRANIARLGSASASTPRSPSGHNIYNAVRAADLSWNDIEWLRSIVTVPLLLKGVMRPKTASTAQRCGCDGIIVSNHGGRALDSVPSTMEVLPAIADEVAGSMPILVDGGIRRGIDMVKALASGANAVLIGRPYLYGLAVDGADGIAAVVNILRLELEIAMGMLGCATVGDLNRNYLVRS